MSEVLISPPTVVVEESRGVAPPTPTVEVESKAVPALRVLTARPASPFRLLPDAITREPTWLRWSAVAIALLFVLFYGMPGRIVPLPLIGPIPGVMFSLWTPAHPGNVEQTYLVGGKQLLAAMNMGVKPTSAFTFVGRGWQWEPSSNLYYPNCTLGMPLLVAAALQIFGAEQGQAGTWAAMALSPIFATLALPGMFLLARQVAGSFAGLLAMLLLGLGQVFLMLAVRPAAEPVSVCFVVWGMFLLVRFMQTGSIWRGLLAGLLIGFAGIIQYGNALLGLCVLIACTSLIRWSPRKLSWGIASVAATLFFVAALATWIKWTSTHATGVHPIVTGLDAAITFVAEHTTVVLSTLAVLAFGVACCMWMRLPALRLLAPIAAWAVPLAVQLCYSHATRGVWMPFTFGEDKPTFAWSHAFFPDGGGNWERMASMLNDGALFAVGAVGLLGMIWMLGRQTRMALVLLAWSVPLVLLSMTYSIADNNGINYARLVMTATPASIVAAVWLISEIVRRVERWPSVASGPLARRLVPASVAVAGGVFVWLVCVVNISRALGFSPANSQSDGNTNILNGKRQYVNLALIGDAALRAVPAGSLVIEAPDEELGNYLQFIGHWDLVSYDSTEKQQMTREFNPRVNEPPDLEPLDPARIEKMRAFYQDKDQRVLRDSMIGLIKDNQSAGIRVFCVLDDNNAKKFEQFCTARKLRFVRPEIVDDLPADKIDDTQKRLQDENKRLMPSPARQDRLTRWWIAEILPPDTTPPPRPAATPRTNSNPRVNPTPRTATPPQRGGGR